MTICICYSLFRDAFIGLYDGGKEFHHYHLLCRNKRVTSGYETPYDAFRLAFASLKIHASCKLSYSSVVDYYLGVLPSQFEEPAIVGRIVRWHPV
jgi:hypothetical protein